jgi:hypothetical protein
MILLCAYQLKAQSVMENTQVRFFANTGYFYEKDSSNKVSHTFDVGNVEMLLTAQLSDKVSVLAEPVFTPSGLNMERVMISYAALDYVKVSAGKLYSPVGLWNTTFYHHVKVLAPTINQPAIIAEPEEFGVLDNNDLGVQLSGENITKVRLGYKLMVGNGYATTKTADKTVTYNVYVEPVDNLKLGVSGRVDNLGIGTINPQGLALTESTSLNLFNASVMYYGGSNKFEFASEFYKVDTKKASTGTGTMTAGFVYAGYKIKGFTPYVMYNRLNYDSNTSWFTVNNFTGSTIGIRYSFGALNVLKIEGQFLDTDQFKKLNRVGIQWAIGF